MCSFGSDFKTGLLSGQHWEWCYHSLDFSGSKKVSKGISVYKQQNSALSAVKKQLRSGAGAKVSSGPSKSLRCWA